MTSTVETVVTNVANEIAQLVASGESWQVVLHGGPGGDVIMEVKRTRRLVPPRKRHRLSEGGQKP